MNLKKAYYEALQKPQTTPETVMKSKNIPYEENSDLNAKQQMIKAKIDAYKKTGVQPY